MEPGRDHALSGRRDHRLQLSRRTTRTSAKSAIQQWINSSGHYAILMSADYNYVALRDGRVARQRSAVLGRRLHQGPRPHAGVGQAVRHPVKQYYTSTRTRVTFRWAGADTLLQVLTSGLRSYEIARRTDDGDLGQLPGDEGDVRHHDLGSRPHVPVPRPCRGLGRQLERLADGHRHALRRPSGSEPGPHLAPEVAMPSEARPGDPRGPDDRAWAVSAATNASMKPAAPRTDRSRSPTRRP